MKTSVFNIDIEVYQDSESDSVTTGVMEIKITNEGREIISKLTPDQRVVMKHQIKNTVIKFLETTWGSKREIN